jgi:hypothetical protein
MTKEERDEVLSELRRFMTRVVDKQGKATLAELQALPLIAGLLLHETPNLLRLDFNIAGEE